MAKRAIETNNKIVQAPLLPLVDVLFSSIGIFLILISFNAITRVPVPQAQTQAEQPDAVMFCLHEDQFILHTQEEPEGIQFQTPDLTPVLDNLTKGRRDGLSLLVAFHRDSFREKESAMAAIRRLKKASAGSIPPEDWIVVEASLWPLSDNMDNPPPVIDVWKRRRDADHDGQ